MTGHTARALSGVGAWPQVPLKTVARMRAGGTPRRGNPDYWGGTIPFVKIEDITAASRQIPAAASCVSTGESIPAAGSLSRVIT